MKQKGKKFDIGKPRLDLLPEKALLGAGDVLSYGGVKYGDQNWRGGLKWSRLIASLLRHLLAFSQGEDKDKESGLPHIDHVVVNALMLSEFFRTHKELDDRYKK